MVEIRLFGLPNANGHTQQGSSISNGLPPQKWQGRLFLSWLALVVLMFLGQLGQLHWFLDLFSHFGFQYGCLLLLLSPFLMMTQRWYLILLAGLGFIFLIPSIAWYYHRASLGPFPDQTRVRIVSTNVLTSNTDPTAVVEFLQSIDADLVILMEISRKWRPLIGSLVEKYPYQEIHDRQDNFGIALIARKPCHEFKIISLDSSGIPSIEAKMEVNGKYLRVIGTHPLPPMGQERTQMRNEHFNALAALVKAQAIPTLVIGDLNCTSWSPHFRRLLKAGGLVDSRKGFGIQPSWPTSIGLLRIPIDHALATNEIAILDRRLGPNVGSDHFPILVDIGLRSSLTTDIPTE